jgi:hypothetical protein
MRGKKEAPKEYNRNVKLTLYPEQGEALGQRCVIRIHRKDNAEVEALCVRDDVQSPYHMIFKLDDGRYILGAECTYCYTIGRKLQP